MRAVRGHRCCMTKAILVRRACPLQDVSDHKKANKTSNHHEPSNVHRSGRSASREHQNRTLGCTRRRSSPQHSRRSPIRIRHQAKTSRRCRSDKRVIPSHRCSRDNAFDSSSQCECGHVDGWCICGGRRLGDLGDLNIVEVGNLGRSADAVEEGRSCEHRGGKASKTHVRRCLSDLTGVECVVLERTLTTR